MLVLDKGEVKLIDFMGGDLSVVAAARVSRGTTIEDASKGEESDSKLINYLMKHKHETPFEHSVFTFYIKCPIFVAREWMRHRIGSFNEISGRYTQFEAEFYEPDKFRIPASSNKQGSVFPDETWLEKWKETWTGPEGLYPVWESFDERQKSVVEHAYHIAYSFYEQMLEQGVAKELARIILPLGLYTQFYWTVNARSLINFLNLRLSQGAQLEMQEYAKAIDQAFGSKMPITHKAWKGISGEQEKVL